VSNNEDGRRQVNDNDTRGVVVSLAVALILAIFFGLYLWYITGSPIALTIAGLAIVALLVTVPLGLRDHQNQL
jgi:membrane protein YdbS with pleckstrin-like domain